MPPTKLLIGSNNAHKVAEFRSLLTDLAIDVVTPAELGITLEPEETGDTFAANARAKAEAFARASGLISLADDSGIVVDALGGAPGVLSARYGGPGLDDHGRVLLLLEHLRDVRPERRQARFVCVIAIAGRDRPTETAEGVVEGIIADEPRGANGFGYDPIFLLPERGVTTAELSPEAKNAISHRGRAAQAAKAIIRRLL